MRTWVSNSLWGGSRSKALDHFDFLKTQLCAWSLHKARLIFEFIGKILHVLLLRPSSTCWGRIQPFSELKIDDFTNLQLHPVSDPTIFAVDSHLFANYYCSPCRFLVIKRSCRLFSLLHEAFDLIIPCFDLFQSFDLGRHFLNFE